MKLNITRIFCRLKFHEAHWASDYDGEHAICFDEQRYKAFPNFCKPRNPL